MSLVLKVYFKPDACPVDRSFAYVEVPHATLADVFAAIEDDEAIAGVILTGRVAPNRSHFVVTDRCRTTFRGGAVLRADQATWQFKDDDGGKS